MEEFVRLEIYLENKEVTRIAEEPQVPWKQMVVNLGGALSLYLGMSFVTVVEVVEMILEMIITRMPAIGMTGSG